MGSLVRAELRKYLTTRMWWGMAIGILLIGAGFAALVGFFLTMEMSGGGPGGEPVNPAVMMGEGELARNVYTAGATTGYILTLAIGVLSIGSEYRHMTVTGTFLASPRRLRVMAAKVVALLGIGAANGIVYLVGAVSAGALVLSVRGYPAFPDAGSLTRTLLLLLLALGLWALIGLGIGILIPNQVAAMLVAVGAAWIVEPIVATVLMFQDWGADVSKYFPSTATTAMLETFGGMAMDGGMGERATLPWWAAALVLAGYAAVMAGVGSWLTTHRDIS